MSKKARLVGVAMWTPDKTIMVRASDGEISEKEGYPDSSSIGSGTASYYMSDKGVLTKEYSAESVHHKYGIDSGAWRVYMGHSYDQDAYNFFVRNDNEE